MRVLRLTAAFAGIAALFTAGGIGRLAAYASIDGGRRRAMFVAARAHAAASMGLVVIAAVPHGDLPGHPLVWLAYPVAGVISGAASGLLIGAVCGGAAPVELSGVWSLARKPSEALFGWLDPRDLMKLGIAVRDRTSSLFGGIFDPAPPPPADAAVPPATTQPVPTAPPAQPAPAATPSTPPGEKGRG